MMVMAKANLSASYRDGYKAALKKAWEELEETADSVEAGQTLKIPNSGAKEVIATVRACAQHLRKMWRDAP